MTDIGGWFVVVLGIAIVLLPLVLCAAAMASRQSQAEDELARAIRAVRAEPDPGSPDARTRISTRWE